MQMIKFGDIFLKDENEYAFLVGVEDGVYAAKILNKEDSREFENYCNRGAAASVSDPSKKKIFYWVKLTTDNLKDRLAHLGSAENAMDGYPYITTGFKLNDDDKRDIIKEISDPDVDLPGELKEWALGMNK